jgi:hypothetical protein
MYNQIINSCLDTMQKKVMVNYASKFSVICINIQMKMNIAKFLTIITLLDTHINHYVDGIEHLSNNTWDISKVFETLKNKTKLNISSGNR